MFLSQDYRSRAIGAIAAMGVLITGVVVDGATTPAPVPQTVPIVAKAHAPAGASRLEAKCETGTVPVC